MRLERLDGRINCIGSKIFWFSPEYFAFVLEELIIVYSVFVFFILSKIRDVIFFNNEYYKKGVAFK